MSDVNRNNGRGIAYLAFAIAISATCISSLVAVSEKRGISNHWQAIDAISAEPRFDKVKAAVLKQHFDAEMLPQARELASIYRQQGKQEDSAKIYRMLWLAPKSRRALLKMLLSLLLSIQICRHSLTL